jgi:hypothetical protein
MNTQTQTNSINQNGCSICQAGQEKYTKCVLGAFWGKTYYQYDYRHTDGELFSTLHETLELCREKRDKWLREKEAKKQSVFMQMHNGTRTGEGSFNVGLQELFYLAGNANRRKLVKAFPEFFGNEVSEFGITF